MLKFCWRHGGLVFNVTRTADQGPTSPFDAVTQSPVASGPTGTCEGVSAGWGRFRQTGVGGDVYPPEPLAGPQICGTRADWSRANQYSRPHCAMSMPDGSFGPTSRPATSITHGFNVHGYCRIARNSVRRHSVLRPSFDRSDDRRTIQRARARRPVIVLGFSSR